MATKKTTYDDATLLFHAMYIMAVVDGSASDAEFQVLEGLLTSVPEFAKSNVDKLVNESKALVVRSGGTLDSLAALMGIKKKPQRLKCFLLAAEVAYASGGIGKAEAHLLRAMAKILHLEVETTRSIIKVLGIKYL